MEECFRWGGCGDLEDRGAGKLGPVFLSGAVCYIDVSRRSCRGGEEVMGGQRWWRHDVDLRLERGGRSSSRHVLPSRKVSRYLSLHCHASVAR